MKIATRPYRKAARLLGIKTPNYGKLYESGSSGLPAVAGAAWEYSRLWLGRYPALWPWLVRLESGLQSSTEFLHRWRNRFRRRWIRVQTLCGIRPQAAAEVARPSLD
ncbi:MAG: hypothetical protein U0992_24595 [Planctomycetaceae bacterium]